MYQRPFYPAYALAIILGCVSVSPGQNERSSVLEQRTTLQAKWQAEVDANRIADAVRSAGSLAELERQLLAETQLGNPTSADQFQPWKQASSDLEATLDWLAETLEEEGDERAFEIRQEVIALTETRLGREDDFRRSELTEEARQALSRAEELQQQGQSKFQAQDPVAATEMLTQAWKLYAEVLGADNPQTLKARAWLPYLYEQRGDYAEAIRWLEEELALLEESLGWNMATAKCLHRLATVYNLSGELGKAKGCYEQSLDTRLRVVGEEHRDTAIAHTALGLIYLWTGDYAGAKPQLERSLEIVETLPPNDLASAANLQNLALLHAMMGDYAKAEPLYQQALVHAGEHPNARAQILDNMGLLYTALANHADAARHYELALAAYQEIDAEHFHVLLDVSQAPSQAATEQLARAIESLEPLHRLTLLRVATTQNNLAWLFTATKEYEKAELLFRRSLAISSAVGGEHRPESAACLDNLGRLHENMGQPAMAQLEYEQALAIRSQVLGENHIETAVSKSNLGLLKLALGDQAAAQSLLRDCLAIRRRHLDESATVQNERQQLLMNQNLRMALDDWVSAVDDESVYAEVLRWKGAVYVRQAALRALRQQPELKPLVDQLRSVSSRFAKLSLTAPKDEASHQLQLQQLSDERERIETLLVEQSQAYRLSREQAALSPVALQSYLKQNEKIALVDLLQYDRFVPAIAGRDAASEAPTGNRKAVRERRFVAFVVRGEGPIQRIELGSADAIDRLVDEYRRYQLQDQFASHAAQAKSAQELRKVIWQPLQQYLEGMETILISPDGSLGKLPFAALPGKEMGTYLLEDYATAVIPVPQSLPFLLSDVPDVEGQVLVLGGVDYDLAGVVETPKPKRKFGKRSGEATESAPTRNLITKYATRLAQYAFLPATKSELNDIKLIYEELFDDPEGISTLAASEATEEAFRSKAPKNRYLHLATHGFFAPEELMSAFSSRDFASRGSGVGTGSGEDCHFIGHNPGLLSGIVLAGANNPAVDGDDGVLTALEVADIDLAGVELAVLSACQTGLGRVAGGEGLLGLQRSFQVAGARSVVASLWEVADDKTSALMRDFYDNMWKDNMGKLQALHQAQLAMLNSNDRGRRIVKTEADAEESRTPPYFWAAFVLSGDWRIDPWFE